MSPLMLGTTLILTGVLTASARPSPQADADDATGARPGVGVLDRFFDTHPAIAQALAKNPSLIDNQRYVASQPALRAFLQDHPGITTQLRTNPQAMMKDLADLDGTSKPVARPVIPVAKPATSAGPLSSTQFNALDSFMDANPTIAKQLVNNPTLINDQGYLKAHPALMTFLNNNPALAKQWQGSPQTDWLVLFNDASSPKGLSAGQINTLDSFLDSHPTVAKQLAASPATINSQSYLKAHPELTSFLQTNPDLAEDWQSNPQSTMNSLATVDAADAKAASTGGHNHGSISGLDNDALPTKQDEALSNRQTVTLDAFLDAHPTLGDQLQSNPSLIGNRTFLNEHPELVAFLQSNPDLGQDWRTNPQAAMSSLARVDAVQAATRRATPDPANTTRADVAKFDAFLDNHSTITEELRAHPTMMNDSAYLKANPELKAFLAGNPRIVAQLRANPALFMRNVQKLDTHDIATAPKHDAHVRGVASVHK